MMELQITVTTPEGKETVYRFAEPRVRVGRSRDCHLSIRHEAVPRELCVAWLEGGGRTVRVEERPRLSNPLLRGSKVVSGGLTGERLSLAVGPIGLRFEPGHSNPPAAVGVGSNRRGRRIVAVGGLFLVAVGVLLLVISDVKNDRTDTLGALPDSPLCFEEAPTCKTRSDCDERARLRLTRARTLLNRPKPSVPDRVRAALFLKGVARLYAVSGSADAVVMAGEAESVERAVVLAYRREVVTLRERLRRHERGPLVARAARRVLAYLGECHQGARRLLRSLATGSGSGSDNHV